MVGRIALITTIYIYVVQGMLYISAPRSFILPLADSSVSMEEMLPSCSQDQVPPSFSWMEMGQFERKGKGGSGNRAVITSCCLEENNLPRANSNETFSSTRGRMNFKQAGLCPKGSLTLTHYVRGKNPTTARREPLKPAHYLLIWFIVWPPSNTWDG